jgi:hypothetical protein
MAGMNQRDRLYIQREWIAWADWVRQGQTSPNALGYKSGTVEYALMRGETGGSAIGCSKVPERFEHDRNAGLLNRVFWSLPDMQQNTITGIYIKRMDERSVAVIIGVTRHKVRGWLSDSYIAGFEAITTEQQNRCVVSG